MDFRKNTMSHPKKHLRISDPFLITFIICNYIATRMYHDARLEKAEAEILMGIRFSMQLTQSIA